MGTPLVSIIVPVYNQERFLQRCVDSLVYQDFPEKEIIFVDDLSSDGSRAILKETQREHSAIVKLILNDKNTGLGASRNAGMHCAAGKYVSFIDGDDWIDSTYISTAIESIEKRGCDIAAMGVKNEYGNPQLSEIRYCFPSDSVIASKYALNLLCRTYNSDIYISSMVTNKIYKRELLEACNLFFEETSQDNDVEFTFKLLSNQCKLALNEKPFYHYAQHEDSMLHSVSFKTIRDLFFSFNRIKEYLEANNRFQMLQENYYALFDKCTTTMMDCLLSSNLPTQEKKDILGFFYEEAVDKIDCVQLLKYIDLRRIRAFYGL